MNWTEIAERLAAPFDPSEVRFRAGPVSLDKSKALAIPYIHVHTVEDRLDQVLGVDGWRDRFELHADGTVLCGLSLRIGDAWVEKQDVGGESKQDSAGDRRKSSFSDALKRAGVKWGIGRYLYVFPRAWCDYDVQSKQLKSRPVFPPRALPAPSGRRHDPVTGPELASLLFDQEATAKLWGCGELVKHVAAAVAQRTGRALGPIALWPRDLVPVALGFARQFARDRSAAKAAAQ